jgi:hypothetical protein
MTVSNEELVKRIASLEAELATLKAQLPKEEKPFVPKPMPSFDPFEGLRMPGNAVKPMADLIHGKDAPKFDKNAWARNSYPQPGGFGAPQDAKPTKEVKRGSGLVEPPPLEGPIRGKWSK